MSGRRLDLADQLYPIWTWTLQYSFLRGGRDSRFGIGPGSGYTELDSLMGFFCRQKQAANATFLFDDPTDDQVTNQGIGYGDGATTSYQLLRTIGAAYYGGLFTEPITQPNAILAVYVNGASVPYSLGANGVVTLNSPPPPGALVSATFNYWWPAKFAEDTLDFDNFAYQLWELRKLSIESVLLP